MAPVNKSNSYLYFFGNKKSEGKGSMREILGGKGAGLAEMTEIGTVSYTHLTLPTSDLV